MERSNKNEQSSRDNKPRLDSNQRKWTRREETDFLKTIWNFGVLYDPEKQTYEWTKFKLLSKISKVDEAMNEYYKGFINMCKRQCGHKIDEETEIPVEPIDPEKARRTLERIELLSKIREETLCHAQLDERLKLCLPSTDLPDWWICGKHDGDLLIGVAKHGLGRSDYHILNDPELSFHDILHKQYTSTLGNDNKLTIKLESPEDILKFDNKNEIVVKLEKGEGTLKIEKVLKKEEDPKKEKLEKIDLDESETEKDKIEEADEKSSEEKSSPESKSEKKKDVDENDEKPERRTTRSKRRQEESEKKSSKDDRKENKKKHDEVSKQAAELKAMFPDLEVIQPLSRLSQIDTYMLRDKPQGAIDFTETTVAQMFNNAIKWPKEYALQMRLQHIVHCVEHGEWPVSKNYTAYSNTKNTDLDIAVYDTPNLTPKRDTSTPMSTSEGSEIITITTDHGGISSKVKLTQSDSPQSSGSSTKRRKKHIAIDVETERAKLHALLNSSNVSSSSNNNQSNNHSNQITTASLLKTSAWASNNDNEDSEESRRSTPVTPQTSLQPPPAHQQISRVLSMPFDLKYQSNKLPGSTISANITAVPSASSSSTSSAAMAPIDLSSG